MAKKDITYVCDQCSTTFSREEVESGVVRLATEPVKIPDFSFDDEVGASVRIGTHRNCGGTVRMIAKKMVS